MGVAGYLAILRRRAWIILLCLAAGLGGAAFSVASATKVYAARSVIFVQLPSTADSVANQQSALQVASGLLGSFTRLVETRETATEVEQTLGLPAGSVYGHVVGAAEANTFFIDIIASDPQPSRARTLADATANVMTDRISQLEGSATTPIHAYVVDRADLPSHPVKPTPRSTFTIGGLIGLVVGIALVALLEALDRSVRSPDEIATLTHAPMLGVVHRRRGTDASRLIVSEAHSEPYRALRTSIRFLNPDRPPQVLLITSPGPGDGKTTTAANLAVAFANAGERVVLVDADLRRSQLTRALGLNGRPGLTSVITQSASLGEALVDQGSVVVLPAGPAPPNPSEILGSQAAAELIQLLRKNADLVVIDAPPLLAVTDAAAIAPQVDAAILIVRHGKTQRAATAEAYRRLDSVSQPVSGFVLNGLARSDALAWYGEYVYAPPRRGLRRR